MKLLALALLCGILTGCSLVPKPVPSVEQRCIALVGPPGDEAYDSCIRQLENR